MAIEGPRLTADGRKKSGAYFTPPDIVSSLVRWVVGDNGHQRMLDPSCGDGRFLAAHQHSVGVEQDPVSARIARERAPHALIHQGDFFSWAATTKEKFDCAAGNPPFIRYQHFSGETRSRALELCTRLGATFSALTSSWAPFLVASASLLRYGGKMAFVVPAEIGHAPYARPLVRYLVESFGKVQIVPVSRKIFSELSEDCWLLYAEDYGHSTSEIELSPQQSFGYRETPPPHGELVSVGDLESWNFRLRPFLLSRESRDVYRRYADSPEAETLGHVARVGIGYVTGANDFFHLRPSQAQHLGIAMDYLHPTVRNGRSLTGVAITRNKVQAWLRRDEPVLLLRLQRDVALSKPVERYLRTKEAEQAKATYKCRNREPWWAVPDVRVPGAFLSYMSGDGPALVANRAQCVCTNSVHAVRLNRSIGISVLQRRWALPLTRLSCEIEGHPLGGGMLKVEPREAARIVLSPEHLQDEFEVRYVREGIKTMRQWRHHESVQT